MKIHIIKKLKSRTIKLTPNFYNKFYKIIPCLGIYFLVNFSKYYHIAIMILSEVLNCLLLVKYLKDRRIVEKIFCWIIKISFPFHSIQAQCNKWRLHFTHLLIFVTQVDRCFRFISSRINLVHLNLIILLKKKINKNKNGKMFLLKIFWAPTRNLVLRRYRIYMNQFFIT